MKTLAPLIDENGEVRELTRADMAQFLPADKVLPLKLQKTMRIQQRDVQRASTKTETTIKIDTDLLEILKSAGSGWQTRINAILREAVEAGKV